MKIVCPKCGADYNISEDKIPADGLHIKCPKCLHSFIASKTGVQSVGATGSMPAMPGGRAPGGPGSTHTGLPAPPPPPPAATQAGPPAPPPPPPPDASVPDISMDLVDEIEELDEDAVGETVAQESTLYVRNQSGQVEGPYDYTGLKSKISDGTLTGAEDASLDGRNWSPLASLPGVDAMLGAPPSALPGAGAPPPPPPAPPPPPGSQGSVGDFDFSFGDSPQTAAITAEPDDFDFSFSDLPAPDIGSVAGGGHTAHGASVEDLFDDLPADLPAPKAERTEIADLPGPRTGVSDLPGPRGGGADLPAPKGGADLPGPRSGLGPNLFDDDLPAPRAGSDLPGLKGHAELPEPKGGSDLPGWRGESGLPADKGGAEVPGLANSAGLPGINEHAGLPGVQGVEGLPGEAYDSLGGGLIAPGGEELPSLPDDAAAAEYASQAAEAAQGGGSRMPPRKLLMIAAPVAVVILVAGVALTFMGGDDPEPRPRGAKVGGGEAGKAGPKPPPIEAKKAPEPGTVAEPAKPDDSGIIKTSDATLAEVAGYREQIGQLEAGGVEASADKVKLTELYAFGALEFPGNPDWAKKALETAKSLDEATAASKDGQRAALVASLANDEEGAVDKALAFARSNSGDARARYLEGHALRFKGSGDDAHAALKKATTLDQGLLAAWRLSADMALKAGRVDKAREGFEHLYKKAPGSPAANLGLAALELRAGKGERAQKLIEQVLALPKERLSGPDRSRALTLRARSVLGSATEQKAFGDLEAAIKDWPQNLEAVNLLSTLFFDKRQYDKALILFQKLVEQGVDSPDIRIMIARCFERLNRREKALVELRKAQDKFAESPAILVELGDILLEQKEYKFAERDYKKALEIDPGYHEATLKLGNLLVAQSKVAEAISFLEGAVEAHGDSATLHFGLGELKLRLAQTDRNSDALLLDAEKQFRTALKLDPSKTDARYHLVETLIALAKADDALAELKRLQARPDFERPLDYQLGQVFQQLGKHDDAIANYDTALAREKDNAQYNLAAAVAYFEKGELKKADSLLKRAASLDSKLVDAHFFIGRVALARNEHRAAIAKLQMAHEEDRENLYYRYWLGRAREDKGDADGAFVDYNVVADAIRGNAKLTEKMCDVFYRRGEYRMKKLRYGEAREDFDEALRCDDSRAETWLAKGDLSFQLGQAAGAGTKDERRLLNEAVSSYKEAVKRDRTLARAHLNIGKSLLRMNQAKQAVPHLKNALANDKKLTEPYYTLGNIYRQLKQRGPARRAFQSYLDRDPSGLYAPEAKAALRDL
jgi:predicted Zn finger-like uncharacterized protein